MALVVFFCLPTRASHLQGLTKGAWWLHWASMVFLLNLVDTFFSYKYCLIEG
jgi:hypothetical protein